MRDKRPAARLAWSVVVSALLGLALTLSLAWAGELWRAARGAAVVVRGADSFMTAAPDGREFEVVVGRHSFTTSEFLVEPKDWKLQAGAERTTYPPAGELPGFVPWPAPGPQRGVGVVAGGFPFPALASFHDRVHSTNFARVPPILSTRSTPRSQWSVRLSPGPPGTAALPTAILWPGLLADTAAWGLLVWCLIFAPARLRRAWRRRAGRCVGCGYDLRGSAGCPECGPGVLVERGA